MQLTVERTGPCVAKVSFSVPYDEFTDEMRKLLVELGKQMRVKGFRPGHVPPQVVEKLQGREARMETKHRFIQRAYERAVEEQKLKPVSHPRVEIQEADVLAGGEFKYDFEVTLRPEFELGSYKGLEIDSAYAPVSEEEVDAAMEQIARNNARPEPAGDEGLPEDGMALCKLEFFFQGESVFEREGLRLSPSTTIPGVDPQAFKQALVGTKDGSRVEVDVVFPADFTREDARGQPGTCTITVEQAFKAKVPTPEELAAMLKVADLAELRGKVREKLEEANRDMENRRVEGELIKRLIDAHSMELPALMVEDQLRGRLTALERELKTQNLAEDDVKKQLEAATPGARVEAERSARAYFVIEAIAVAEGLQVSEQELVAELRSIAERNRSSFEEVRNYYREKNLLPQLGMEMVERKVRAFLREKATLKAEREKA